MCAHFKWAEEKNVFYFDNKKDIKFNKSSG